MNTRFRILSTVAEGGYSHLFHAFDSERDIEVALKRVRAEVRQAADQLANETRVMSALSAHAGVPRLLDHGHDEQGAWLSREWIDGETLDARLENGPMTERDGVRVFGELLTIVEGIHKAGFAHADLNECNVLLAPKGRVKVIDFGNAVSLPSDEPNTKGSVYHMAPELFDHHPPSVSTDLYALGVIGYRIVTGRYPFEGDTKVQVITSHLRHTPPPFCHPLNDGIMCLLSREPSERMVTHY